MATGKNLGSVKRFGTRYGRTTRSKIAKIESNLKKKHVCPFCKKEGVKRVSTGIWECNKCGSKFTGKAYSFDTKKVQNIAKVSREVVN